ncbi:MAG: sensor histidine kinase [Ruminococcaceae bacterium]|nr:sensor histidine kinase [Oscillospiraceae bacterium]
MTDLSLYILDITMNSVRAGANNISVTLFEEGGVLTMRIVDDGCGMTEEQVKSLSDPFFTTRTTRKVGLGVPFLRMLAEQTGGSVCITSKSEKEYSDHGTVVEAVFHTDHIDFIPMGDIVETVVTLVQGSPNVDFRFHHRFEGGEAALDTAEMRVILGGDIPLDSFEILSFIREYLKDQYAQK